jgi:hypothetical protein
MPSSTYRAEIDLERIGWAEITGLVALLTEQERLARGYFVEPDWSVRDLVAHLAAWFAEARMQLLDIAANVYVPNDFEIDHRNAVTLAASGGEPWSPVWTRANDARDWMLEAWFELREPSETATAWIRKAGAEHYGEHVPRLRAWVREVIRMRDRPPEDTWGW